MIGEGVLVYVVRRHEVEWLAVRIGEMEVLMPSLTFVPWQC
jgi:hypothetical protein